MNPIDTTDEAELEAIARRHGFGIDATRTMFDAVVLGNGSMAQFSHPEFGGSGQWMRGGMTMVGDMFNHRLKSAVDALCTELASLAASRSRPAHGGLGDETDRRPADRGYRAPGGAWWPGDLGAPNASGAQNGARYAYFADARRLAIDDGGQVTVYDTGEHRIGSVSQQQSSGSRLSFTSQQGLVDVGRLPVVQPAPGRGAEPAAGPVAAGRVAGGSVAGGSVTGGQVAADAEPRRGTASPEDLPSLIEKLADLQSRGILTEEEFSRKKAELLRRI